MATSVCDYNLLENNSTSYSFNSSALNMSSHNPMSETNSVYLMKLQYMCDRVMTPIVLCFGIIGNAISISVLWRKRLRHTFDEVEPPY